MIKALILDLDNTIYPAKSIGDAIFANIEDLMNEYAETVGKDTIDKAKDELTRTAFQKVADKYGFPEEFKKRGVEILKNTAYDGPIEPYGAYHTIEELNIDKYLVTFGFVKLQQSKIDGLSIRSQFKDVVVVDPEETSETKKNVFERIMQQNGYQPQDLLVIGDDPESEIKAGKELGIATYLFDIDGRYHAGQADYYERDFEKVKELIEIERRK